MFHAIGRIIRDNFLLVLVLLGSAFLGSTSPTAAQVPTPAVATLTGTAYRLVDQAIVDGVVVDETEVPITDGRIAIPELGIDMPLAADGTFNLSNLPVSADPDNPTEVTVIFAAPKLGSFTYLHLRIGQGYRPILTPQLIDSPRVTDVTNRHTHAASPALPDSIGPASGQVCQPSGEVLVLPPTIRVWENGPGQNGQVNIVDFKFYAKHVLPREWDALWNDQSLPAGAMAVKSYAWWHATHTHKHVFPGPECYDVDAGETHQVFNPFLEDEFTNAAVDATWDFYMIERSSLHGDIVQAFYKAGYKNPPPPQAPADWDACGEWNNGGAPGNDMSQWGSHSCAQAGMPWYQILTIYYFPPPVSWILLRASHDTDGDGCTNGEEVGNNEAAGGRRSPLNFWDFYDTPNASNVRNKVVDLSNDIFGVQLRFDANDAGGTAAINRYSDPLAGPIPPPPAYHPAFDRGPIVGPNAWNLGPADGVISLAIDIFGVSGQFDHSCVAPP